ncbi:MAG: alanine--tRNA ligase [Nitrosopumilus sp. B06]|nr:MAG: alanine--tRNA ligase [Nitrosopumilus sp. B06]
MKSEIQREFSADPDRYYRVRLFEERGFVRKACSECGRFFWTLDASRDMCPDDAQDTYSFIGDPPTSKRFDYTQAWRQVEEFFVKNGHTSVGRYPTVCRWRDDLYFTIASIVDFQRVMGSKVVFEFPANPLVVPQTCLRFKDLENVGVTGRHFSSFCMIGQHSIADSEGYWKDRCVELDYKLVTEQFGIRQEEVVFVEDVWAGGGSFGPSLEYFVRGLELGNAVFTEFQGELGRHTTLDQRIIDMGAGLERFAWITNGTPTAYDCCFGPVNEMLLGKMGIDMDSEVLRIYFTEVAKGLDRHDLNEVRRRAKKAAGISDERQNRMITRLEGAYLIADHLRTLIFAIADGALPSNVGGGYNLRMMLRRIIGTAGRLDVDIDMGELVDAHIDYLCDTYPELDSKRDDVKEILEIEESRYGESRQQMRKKAQRIQNPTVDELLTLYESDGITPEYLREVGAIQEIPSTFYSKLSELHQSEKKKGVSDLLLDGIPETEMLFYGDDPAEFDAQVLRVIDDCVILDRTSFYARGGGQEPDHGSIAGCDVVDVEKHAGVIVHKLRGTTPKKGDTVSCVIDTARRDGITKNHTSTHILNASSRAILGSWVWQHSAFKDHDHARLDITHHSSLTTVQVQQIEDAANKMIRDNLPVTIQYFERGAAEQKYGFSIYQGGVVPVKSVRIVSIRDADVEACGGTHVRSTGEIGQIKITRTKRIQDGIVRLEFVSGAAASEHVKRRQVESQKDEENARQKEQLQKKRDESREKTRGMIPELLERAAAGTIGDVDGIESENKACLASGNDYDEFFHTSLGKKLISRDPGAAYCGIFESGTTVRIVVYCGSESGMDARIISRDIAIVLGGSSGGGKEFAQGGGKDTSKKASAIDAARSMILGRRDT